MGVRKINSAQRDTIVREIALGSSLTDMARTYGISVARVSQIVKEEKSKGVVKVVMKVHAPSDSKYDELGNPINKVASKGATLAGLKTAAALMPGITAHFKKAYEELEAEHAAFGSAPVKAEGTKVSYETS